MPTPEEFRQLFAQILGPAKHNAITGVVNAQQLADRTGMSYEQAKAQMRERRDYAHRRQGLLRELQGMGYSLQDMGFQNKHEMGASAFAKYGKGGFATNYGTDADGSYEYDWASGRKRNVKTSDVTARDRWIPISEKEYASKQEAERMKAMGLDTFAKQQQYRMGNTSGQKMSIDANSLMERFGFGKSGQRIGSFSGMSRGDAQDPNRGGFTGQSFAGPSKQGFAAPTQGGTPLPSNYQTMGGSSSGGSWNTTSNPDGSTYSMPQGTTPMGAGGQPLSWNPYMPTYQNPLESAMTDSIRNDTLQQQIGIQKQLEGHAMGKPIYDYMLNEVYGPILGAQFNSGQQQANQYGQNVTGQAPTGGTAPSGGTTPSGGVNSQPGQVSRMNEGMSGSQATGGIMGGQQPRRTPTSRTREAASGAGSVAGQRSIATDRNRGFQAQTTSTPGGQPAQVTTQTATTATGTTPPAKGQDPSTNTNGGANGLIMIPTAQGVAIYDPATGKTFANMQEMGDYYAETGKPGGGGGSPSMNPPENWREEIQKSESQRAELGLTPGQHWPEQVAKPWAMPGGYYTGGQGGSGGGPSAVGNALPTGSYKQTGSEAMDPNMNKTWARFLAPTYNKVSQMTDRQLQEIRAQMPRGGQQDQAVSDAIQNKYSTIASGWQSLVPVAMQGVEGIGREMYFQQPNANSGALGVAEGARQANQQYQLGLQQMKAQEDAASDQKKSSFWSGLGTIAGGAVGFAVGGPPGAAIGASGGGALGSSLSDSRAKKDVKDFTAGLKELRKLDPVSYKYNGKAGSVDGAHGISLMAQQLEKVIPEAVEKKDTPDGPYRFISPLALQMTTINAVKELDRKISALGRK